MESVKSVQDNKYICHDCGKNLKVTGDKFTDGVSLVYEGNGEKIKIAKCDECFKKSPELTNFQPCEVYSRIVGYIRPVQQWHIGKKEEFKERENYKT